MPLRTTWDWDSRDSGTRADLQTPFLSRLVMGHLLPVFYHLLEGRLPWRPTCCIGRRCNSKVNTRTRNAIASTQATMTGMLLVNTLCVGVCFAGAFAGV